MLAITAATILTLLCVGAHFEALHFASTWVALPKIAPRLRVAFGVLLAIGAHIIEVLIFTVGWALLLYLETVSLSEVNIAPADLIYFSFVNYTSLGYGDIVPLGAVGRILAGVECLVGLVLIAWTASFTYAEMKIYWFDAQGKAQT